CAARYLRSRRGTVALSLARSATQQASDAHRTEPHPDCDLRRLCRLVTLSFASVGKVEPAVSLPRLDGVLRCHRRRAPVISRRVIRKHHVQLRLFGVTGLPARLRCNFWQQPEYLKRIYLRSRKAGAMTRSKSAAATCVAKTPSFRAKMLQFPSAPGSSTV